MKIAVLILMLSGIASQYAPGVMDSVIAVHNAGLTCYNPPNNLSKYDGFIAMESCDELGNEYYIQAEGQPLELFLVTDCSGHLETTNWMSRNNIIAEVDYRTAFRWDTVGYGIAIHLYREVYRYEYQ